ncbi:acyl-CoA thioesterase [Shimia sp. R9_3]|uniref:acyl-CoA thioesterase n=1 Tax=Shimia sp. R9_3 TaxID=2821113 RepID=UPI001AD98700|nr:acyl-CoA thioesterase [Shimia sp. R9_3]MBO9399246.1 acyl-CoA thioesterase [Shimia sp. R9_3]
MYPVMRMIKELVKYRNATPLPLTGTHVSEHRCWPSDIDLWMELNNGRTLTLFDLGRIPLASRIGLVPVLRKNKWSMTMAGATVRYRRRIRTFEKIEMRSRTAYWDDRFVYIEQSMWKQNGECANHALYRAAITNRQGIVPPAEVMEALGRNESSPPAPEWIKAWIDAEATRPWPPMQE